MQPKSSDVREAKDAARSAGALGVFVLRGVEDAELRYQFADSVPLALELAGKMLVIAVFEETDGEANGIES